MKADFSFYNGKRVFVTGHTGFKGSYLVTILRLLGAEVFGYALPPETDPALFSILGLGDRPGVRSVTGDIRDLSSLQKAFSEAEPEIVFHLAAQPIVRASYREPVKTYETNVMGTVNVLECVRNSGSVRSFLNVTTDKVYENTETDRAYREDDRLNGYDPYSNSKSCSELLTDSYRKSFLRDRGIAVSTARSGNVIGGGDYAEDRIVPDAVRAAKKGEPLIVRNPGSTRPFQHVLEPLSAYLLIAMRQAEDTALSGAYNVGPSDGDIRTAGRIADLFCAAWGEGMTWKHEGDNGPHEAKLLRLDSEKIEKTLGWRPTWDLETAIERTVEFEKAADKTSCVEKQIRDYFRE